MLVDIITGFLGAGKTTLINQLIPIYRQRGEKVVIIENEYGNVAVDAYLFENKDIAVYELTNGCLCCTLKSNLELSLQEISQSIKPDRVIIEPSGIFVIDEILTLFKTIAFKAFKVNQIITVVDAVHFIKYRYKYNALLGAQISSANKIIVSKVHDQTDIAAVQSSIREFNSNAPIFYKPWHTLSEEDFTGTGGERELFYHSSKRRLHKILKKASRKSKIIPHTFTTHTIQANEDYTQASFLALLEELNKQSVLRCKGFITLEHKNYIFQYTAGTYTLEEILSVPQEKVLVSIQ
jgi:G3E family GTPase